MPLTVLVRQTQDPSAEPIQYIAQSKITLRDNTYLDMSPSHLGVGNPGDIFYGAKKGRSLYRPSMLYHANGTTTPYMPVILLADLIEYDEELGATIMVIEKETASGLWRYEPTPPLECCKQLFADLWNQLLSAFHPNSPHKHTRPPSPTSEDINHTHKDSAKTAPVRSGVTNSSGVIRHRLGFRDGYFKIPDDGEDT